MSRWMLTVSFFSFSRQNHLIAILGGFPLDTSILADTQYANNGTDLHKAHK